MKYLILIAVAGCALLMVSCITWVRDTTDPKVTHGLIGHIIETNQKSLICGMTDQRAPKFSTGYIIWPASWKPIPENRIILEKCPPGTRGRIVRFFKERDSGQFIWDYVEFEMDDPRLKQKYRIVRMLGRHNVDRHDPWDPKDGDFRLVNEPNPSS